MMLINGMPEDRVSALDRGLHYGDGLFETMAVHGGGVPLWSRHMTRLTEGCLRLGIAMPDESLLAHEAGRLCADVERAVLKIIITRGAGGAGYRTNPDATPTRVVMLRLWPDHPAVYYAEGIRARVCTTRLAGNPALAGIKHLNRLEQVLARAEWNDAAIAEGIMLDRSGHVIEGVSTNLFLVSAGNLVTPDLSECGVAGIMRGMIIEHAAQCGLPCEIRSVTLDKLYMADEILVCNSVIGIWPVRQLDDRMYAPGQVTRRLMQSVSQPR